MGGEQPLTGLFSEDADCTAVSAEKLLPLTALLIGIMWSDPLCL